jgi:hypothetical protein
MIYVSLGKSHIKEQVEKLKAISIPKNTYTSIRDSIRSSQ